MNASKNRNEQAKRSAIKTQTKSIWHRLFIACLSGFPLPRRIVVVVVMDWYSSGFKGLNFVASITCHSCQNFNYTSTLCAVTSLWFISLSNTNPEDSRARNHNQKIQQQQKNSIKYALHTHHMLINSVFIYLLSGINYFSCVCVCVSLTVIKIYIRIYA